MSETTTPDALTASAKADRPVLTTIKVGDAEFPVTRKPNTLLIAELARTGSGDPEAIGVLAEFFEYVMGKETYGRFKRAFYAQDFETDDAEQESLLGYIGQVIEETTGRPTK